MIYSNDDIRELYLNINETVKQKPQASLEELSKELNARIDLKQKFHNGCVLGDLLLALAIEKSNLDFIKFLFKNELKIISIISQQEETCHIPKTINGQSILNYAVHFGNTEILDLLLDVWSQRVMVYYHHHLRSHYGTDITWVRQNNTDDS
ncbi:ankyrin repeat domain-containing protein [Wolbachia endosymbiont (group A) of Campoletis raptor]|uniref:ankyrin repeat domain-containing protein n=1 Tax=Wolbachia endosymbiont (group A) of Campoletis raptor TaxID=3066196 RepID=UPI0031330C5F